MQTTTERFWSKVDRSGDCWLWTACISIYGYGDFWQKRGTKKAHRVAYEFRHGPVPAGLQIDHLCRNRACVNPDHMEVVTNRVNGLRGISQAAFNAKKTHCMRGHEFNDINTYRDREGNRGCRPCRTARNAARTRRVARKEADGSDE